MNIHATCISYQGKGILLIGSSGSGKSDLALRLIMDKGARLVADDRTDIELKNGKIIASAPENLLGLIEVRGVGICHFSPLKKAEVGLVIEMARLDDVDRLPAPETYELLDIKIPKLKLYPFEPASVAKVILALTSSGKTY